METNVGGLRAVELYYRGIREIETGETAFFQSKTRLNTPDLGTLMPENFRGVAELSNQASALFMLELKQAMEAGQKFRDRNVFYRWLSVYMPGRTLLERGIEQKILELLEETRTDNNRVCFELSTGFLTEGAREHLPVMEHLRNLGFHFILPEFGGTSCPVMRLSEFPIDYVMLSRELISYVGKGERSQAAVKAIVEFAQGLGADSIADGVTSAQGAEWLYQTGCRFAAGALAGKYITERYVRRKGEN